MEPDVYHATPPHPAPPPPTRKPGASRRARVLACVTGGIGALLVSGFVLGALGGGRTAMAPDAQTSGSVPATLGAPGAVGVATPAPAPTGAPQPQDPGSTTAAGGANPSAPPPPGPPTLTLGKVPANLERSLSASFTVSPGKVQSSFDAVSVLASQLGGYVESSTSQQDDAGLMATATIVVRVPAEHLADMVNQLPADFQTSTRNFSSVDHTAQFVDVNKRLQIAKDNVAALQRALAAASAPSDIASINSQLVQAQQDAESLQGSLNQINEQVTMSTATLSLTQRGVSPPPPPAAPSHLGSALTSGWDNDLAIAGAVLFTVLTAIPLVIVLVPLWVIGRFLYRKLAPHAVGSVAATSVVTEAGAPA